MSVLGEVRICILKLNCCMLLLKVVVIDLVF
jgi:hypothetical protein